LVGIVVVAHSSALAESVIAIAKQMLREEVPLAAAGGIDDPGHPFGTDPLRIVNAIQSVYSQNGVLILMDMGSSLLSAEMALDFLPEEKRNNVRLCEAPLVEGTIAAAVQAEAGGTVDQVVKEALSALAAKGEQLRKRPDEGVPETSAEIETDISTLQTLVQAHVIVPNALGIHARPAARLVAAASKFCAEIRIENVTKKRKAVTAKSLNSITTLGALQGDEILITAWGEDAHEAVHAMKSIVENGFGEANVLSESEGFTKYAGLRKETVKTTDSVKRTRTEGVLMGEPISPGIAIGPVALYTPRVKDIPEYRSTNPEDEWNRLMRAIELVRSELKEQRMRVQVRVGEYEASMLDAHLLSLQDPVLIDSSREHIFHQFLNAEAAWNRSADEMRDLYLTIEDDYIRSRSQDLEAVKSQVLRCLIGSAAELIPLSRPSVLIADDLSLIDAVSLDPDLVLGICTASGSPASHAAVLVRSLGIPTLFRAGAEILEIPECTTVVLDANNGQVLINPADVGKFKRRVNHSRSRVEERSQETPRPAVTLDGTVIEVDANIHSVQEARAALALGADGVGVFRTELLFLTRVSPPTEEEQISTYTAMARLMGSRPLTIRTIDAGGDKAVPYLHLQKELNPFLGRRGIRLCVSHKELLRTQVRAVLRSAPGHKLKLLFPMVSTLEEIRWAKEIVRDEQMELAREGTLIDPPIDVGIMIEVPSAVFLAEQFSEEVDFFSIGTNDLTQYIMAADRTNPLVADLNDALHPAVLRAVKQVTEAGHGAGIEVGVCGEIAGDIRATPLLVGLQLDELSMAPHRIPEIKRTVSRISIEKAQKLSQEALCLVSAQEVRELIAAYFPVGRNT